MRDCPICGRRLVFCAIIANGKMMSAWACDCEQRDTPEGTRPTTLISSIMRAREWDEGAVVINL